MKKQLSWGIFCVAMLTMGLFSSGAIFVSNQTINQTDYDSDGLKFIGIKRRGRAEGPGTLMTQSGELYVGGFSDGRFDGEGQLILNDGSIYKGSFKKGKINKEGHLQIPGEVEIFDNKTQPKPKPKANPVVTADPQEDTVNEN